MFTLTSGKDILHTNQWSLPNSWKWDSAWNWRETFCSFLIIKTCIPFIIKKTLRKEKRKREEGGQIGERERGEGASRRWKASSKYNRREATTLKVPFSPHKLTISVLATLQPRVPAPSSRHLADTTLSKSKVGTNLQHINLRFRSTDDSANLKMRELFIFSVNHSFVPWSCPF